MRLDLVIEEDMAEEIGRIVGYDRVAGKMPEINLPRLGKAGKFRKKLQIWKKFFINFLKWLKDHIKNMRLIILRLI